VRKNEYARLTGPGRRWIKGTIDAQKRPSEDAAKAYRAVVLLRQHRANRAFSDNKSLKESGLSGVLSINDSNCVEQRQALIEAGLFPPPST